MNQPASKEPTMDEILSSIRQIIADDDEAAAQKMPSPRAAAPMAPKPVPVPDPEPQAFKAALIDPFSDDDEDEVAPLALSPEQIVAEPEPEEPVEMEMPSLAGLDAVAEPVVPDHVTFAEDRDEEPELRAESVRMERPAEAARAQPNISQAAPMPDSRLSSDLADQLLEPATSAAVRNAFSRLDTPRLSPDMALGANGLTIEAMIREMLRPMLKDWLDENLPSMVERIVTQEIERVSRGG